MISELFAAALVVSTGSVVESGSGVASADWKPQGSPAPMKPAYATAQQAGR